MKLSTAIVALIAPSLSQILKNSSYTNSPVTSVISPASRNLKFNADDAMKLAEKMAVTAESAIGLALKSKVARSEVMQFYIVKVQAGQQAALNTSRIVSFKVYNDGQNSGFFVVRAKLGWVALCQHGIFLGLTSSGQTQLKC
ncbi:unnamed protein product [Diplocarpon coronariae]|uniref:Uncharacterized protein n=1 Tax=Diplocarpon coronariae TaxID=2795749 RepID=A0A218Z3H1_9HELO|nr:hypothetical protein B2J93_4371 [Marssonina coronariae]